MPQGKLTGKEINHLRDCLSDVLCAKCDVSNDLTVDADVDFGKVKHGDAFSFTCVNCGNDETVDTSLFFQKGWDA